MPTTLLRDYVAEMRAYIDGKTDVEEYNAGQIAQSVVRELQETDPDLLDGWLRINAVNLIREVISTIDRSNRARVHLTSKRTAFKAAAEAASTGDIAPLRTFLDVRYVVDTSDTRKKLSDMTAGDLIFVAEDYETRAKKSAMHAIFMRRLAVTVGSDHVSDHFTDDQLNAMWRSLK